MCSVLLVICRHGAREELGLNGKCGGGCVATTLLICSTCSLSYKVELLFHIIEKGTASECKIEIQKSLQLPGKTHFLTVFSEFPYLPPSQRDKLEIDLG